MAPLLVVPADGEPGGLVASLDDLVAAGAVEVADRRGGEHAVGGEQGPTRECRPRRGAASAYSSWSSEPATTLLVPWRTAAVSDAWTPAAGWPSLGGSVTGVYHSGAPEAENAS